MTAKQSIRLAKVVGYPTIFVAAFVGTAHLIIFLAERDLINTYAETWADALKIVPLIWIGVAVAGGVLFVLAFLVRLFGSILLEYIIGDDPPPEPKPELAPIQDAVRLDAPAVRRHQ